MKFRLMEKRVTDVFSSAGIVLDGREVWDIVVRVPDKFFTAVALHGHDGFADSYVKGHWECLALDQCITRLITSGAVSSIKFRLPNLWLYINDLLWNRQKPGRARRNVSRHYNLGAVFDVMLDQTKCYSCGYWANATDLEGAQVAKLDHICQKLGLRPGRSFCDIGCGWGGLLLRAASEYRCNATGITLASDQYNYIKGLDFSGLPDESSLSVRLEDYRSLRGQFDRIASVGMFEHVGYKNYRRFMLCVNERLNSRGLFLLHTIGIRHSWPTLHQNALPWIERNIFPGAALPSMGQITTAAEGIFKVLDQENFGPYYDLTLMAWARNFEKGWESIKHLYKNGREFRRMWLYYLYSCAAGFRSGNLDLFQVVLAKSDWRGLYKPVRQKIQSPVVEHLVAQ